MKFMISRNERPNNHPIHIVHTNLESLFFYSDMSPVDDDSQIVQISEVLEVINSVQENLIAKEEKNDVDYL